MNLERIYPSLQVGLVNYYPSVKTARAEKRLIEGLRSVGGAKDQYSLGGVKAVHL